MLVLFLSVTAPAICESQCRMSLFLDLRTTLMAR